MRKVTIYTDGACSFNPGPGGWAAVLIHKGNEKDFSGFVPDTTNNRMELTAVLKALQALREPCHVVLHTDSAYIVNAFNRNWIDNWQRNGWRTANKKDVENQDLWQGILAAMRTQKVHYKKVKGHSTNKYNNICDELARKAITDNVNIKDGA